MVHLVASTFATAMKPTEIYRTLNSLNRSRGSIFSGQQRECHPVLQELRLRHRRDQRAVLQTDRACRRLRLGEEDQERERSQ